MNAAAGTGAQTRFSRGLCKTQNYLKSNATDCGALRMLLEYIFQ